MSFSYSADPENSDRDAVRLLAFDTDPDEYFLEDSEVDYVIAQEANVIAAAARACEIIATKFAREVALRAGAGGELRLEMEQASKAYMQRARQLRQQAIAYAAPQAVSTSINEKIAQLNNIDRVPPFFKRNQFKGGETLDKTILNWNRYGME